MFNKIRKAFTRKKEETVKEKSDMDYWIESATWFCRDFNLSPEEVEQLVVKLKAVETEPHRAMTKVVSEELEDHLSSWNKGKQVLRDREKETGENTGDFAYLTSSQIYNGYRAKKQSGRMDKPHMLGMFPYRIIEKGSCIS